MRVQFFLEKSKIRLQGLLLHFKQTKYNKQHEAYQGQQHLVMFRLEHLSRMIQVPGE